MSNYGVVINARIKNADATSGVLDDSEVIGGVKILQTKSDLETLKYIETVWKDETSTQDLKPRKHILKDGSLAFVADTGLFYRWHTKKSETDKNGIQHATEGDWIEEAVLPDLNDKNVLVDYRYVTTTGVTKDELDAITTRLESAITKVQNDAISSVNSAISNAQAVMNQQLTNFETKVGNSIASTVNTAVNNTVSGKITSAVTTAVGSFVSDSTATINAAVDTAVNTAVNNAVPTAVNNQVGALANSIKQHATTEFNNVLSAYLQPYRHC